MKSLRKEFLYHKCSPVTFREFVEGMDLGDQRTESSLIPSKKNVAKTVPVSRTTSMWPPWPLSLLQRWGESQDSFASSSSNEMNSEEPRASSPMYQYPSIAAMMLAYVRQRTRIWVRQLEEIGSQVWFNLPPATPPLILLASIPRRVVTEYPSTGQEISKLVFPVFSNPLARSMIAFGLGVAVLSWSQQELKRKRKLTPLPLATPYESVSRVFLPPFLPEEVPEPELEALEKVMAAGNNDRGDLLFGVDQEEEGNNILSKVSPKIRKQISGFYETAANQQKNMKYYWEEWKRGRLSRKLEAAKVRRLHIFDELVALQAFKRQAAAKVGTPSPWKNQRVALH